MSSTGGPNNKIKPQVNNSSQSGTNKSRNNTTKTGNTTQGTSNKSAASANQSAAASANQSAAASENLSELLASNASNLVGINTTDRPTNGATNNKLAKGSNNNSSGKNKPSTPNNLEQKRTTESAGLFDDLFASTTAPQELGAVNAVSNPAQTLVSTTETAIKSASNKISEVKNVVNDRLQELSSGTDLWMNLLKISITILILIALFFVAKYLFTQYQDSVYAAPMLLDGIKNGKHALVISQDPENPSYIPMPNSDNQASLELTYDFWMLIDSYEYKKGEWKHIFHKGNSSSYPNRAPGIWLHPDTNTMRVYMNTQDNILEYVDIDNLPLRKWIHVSLVLHDMDLDIFINGYLKKRQKLTSVPKLNNGDFWVNMFGGFDGYLARIRYYGRAIGIDEIASNVRSGPGNSSCIETGQIPPYLDDDWWIQ